MVHLFSLLVLIGTPLVASAQDLNQLTLTVIPNGDLLTVLGRLLQQILLIIGILAFFYLLYAGINYVTSGGDPAKAKTSMGTIVNVAIGIIIIAVSYLLLRFVIDRTSGLRNAATTNSTTTTRNRTNSGSGSTTGNGNTSSGGGSGVNNSNSNSGNSSSGSGSSATTNNSNSGSDSSTDEFDSSLVRPRN